MQLPPTRSPRLALPQKGAAGVAVRSVCLQAIGAPRALWGGGVHRGGDVRSRRGPSIVRIDANPPFGLLWGALGAFRLRSLSSTGIDDVRRLRR